MDLHLPPSNTINRSQGTGLLLNLSCVTRAGSGEKVSLKRNTFAEATTMRSLYQDVGNFIYYVLKQTKIASKEITLNLN